MVYDMDTGSPLKDGAMSDHLCSVSELSDELQQLRSRLNLAEEALQRSRGELARAAQLAQLGGWQMKVETGELLCSREALRILGLEASAEQTAPVSIERFLKVVHANDRQLVETSIARAIQDGETLDIEHRISPGDGTQRIIRQLGDIERDAGGNVIRLVGTLQDITERLESEEQMRLLARVFENTIEGIMVTDAGGVIRMINSAFTAITEFSAEDVIGSTPRALRSGLHGPEFYDSMWQALIKNGHWQGEIWNRRRGGEAYPEWLTITAIKDQNGRATHYVGVFHDITETKRNEETIVYQAYHDALTGLPNRTLFNDRLTMAVAHAQRKHQGLAVLFLDLDNFKQINDSLGHAVGDLLLQSVARRLTRWLREEDTVARIGGDEFIILLQGTSGPDFAVHVAKRILASVSEPVIVKGHELYVTACIGITLYPHDGKDIETLVANADIAMYRAKDEGRGMYKLFTAEMNEQVRLRLDLEGRLRKALERDELEVYYQPKVDLASGEIAGVEALVRWQSPEQGLIMPESFISLAEETGLIVQIGEWVLKTACNQAKEWHEQGFNELQVSVNLSPRQFQQRNLVEMVRATLEASGLAAKYLDLEVTENVLMHSIEQATETLRRLSELGVQLSMDDFGRGYSSLYYLKQFRMQALKIDRLFMSDVVGDPDDASIVNTIISISRSLNLKVVAEGVETREQLEFLRERNCDQMQGFLFSKAVPAADLTGVLEAGTRLV
jgi:diguanylate cyclase (GGDEF)-like protein/PAS domain S-box-containing protein